MAPSQQVLGVRRAESGALASHIVKVLVADGDVILFRGLVFPVVYDRPFRSVTGHFVSMIANCPVGAGLLQSHPGGIVHIGSVGLILIPRLRGCVPFARGAELVIPRGVVGGQVVIGVAPVVERVVAYIDIVEPGAPCVSQAGVARQFAVLDIPWSRLAARGGAELQKPMIT